jgi:hypothetical protein
MGTKGTGKALTTYGNHFFRSILADKTNENIIVG